jgi:hypothetical protein
MALTSGLVQHGPPGGVAAYPSARRNAACRRVLSFATRLCGLLFVLPMRCVQSALRPVDSMVPPLALLLQGSFFLRALTRVAPDLGGAPGIGDRPAAVPPPD